MKITTSKLITIKGKIFKYFILPKRESGRRNRFNVIVPTSEDPVVVGRELPLGYIKKYLKEFERVNNKVVWFGGRKQVLAALKRYKNSL